MKRCCILLLLLVGCSSSTPDPSAATEQTTLSFSVKGMHCQACVEAITASVEQVDGVSECNVSLKNERAVVQVNDPALGPTILEVIRGLQFNAETIDQ